MIMKMGCIEVQSVYGNTRGTEKVSSEMSAQKNDFRGRPVHNVKKTGLKS